MTQDDKSARTFMYTYDEYGGGSSSYKDDADAFDLLLRIVIVGSILVIGLIKCTIY